MSTTECNRRMRKRERKREREREHMGNERVVIGSDDTLGRRDEVVDVGSAHVDWVPATE